MIPALSVLSDVFDKLDAPTSLHFGQLARRLLAAQNFHMMLHECSNLALAFKASACKRPSEAYMANRAAAADAMSRGAARAYYPQQRRMQCRCAT